MWRWRSLEKKKRKPRIKELINGIELLVALLKFWWYNKPFFWPIQAIQSVAIPVMQWNTFEIFRIKKTTCFCIFIFSEIFFFFCFLFLLLSIVPFIERNEVKLFSQWLILRWSIPNKINNKIRQTKHNTQS